MSEQTEWEKFLNDCDRFRRENPNYDGPPGEQFNLYIAKRDRERDAALIQRVHEQIGEMTAYACPGSEDHHIDAALVHTVIDSVHPDAALTLERVKLEARIEEAEWWDGLRTHCPTRSQWLP